MLLREGELYHEKITVNVCYDDEKLSALRLYLGRKNTTVESELETALENLYEKVVPANVREFLEMRTGGKTAEKKKKPTPASAPPVRERSDGD